MCSKCVIRMYVCMHQCMDMHSPTEVMGCGLGREEPGDMTGEPTGERGGGKDKSTRSST